MNSSYFKSPIHLSIIFIGTFVFAICSLPFYFVYNYLYYLIIFKSDRENSLFEHKTKQQREHEMSRVCGPVTQGGYY